MSPPHPVAFLGSGPPLYAQGGGPRHLPSHPRRTGDCHSYTLPSLRSYNTGRLEAVHSPRLAPFIISRCVLALQAMTSRHHPSGQPSSPWAQIFYPSRDPFWSTRGDGLAHSGLAPEYPALTRDNLGDGKIVVNGLPKPSPADLDRLFYGERQQRDALGGLMTWQMGALREKFYTFEQATQHDTRCLDSLTIDEATWFPCFRKDRWLDHPSSISQHLRNPIAGILAGHPTDRMTVDNPLVWSEMRVCIEIANRILSQLIHSRNCLSVAPRVAGLVSHLGTDIHDISDSTHFSSAIALTGLRLMPTSWPFFSVETTSPPK